MIAFVDLRAVREQSSDHLELRAYLQQLVGQPFLLIRFSYGDELTVHFGQPKQYRSSKLAHLTRGAYIIGARASSWFMRIDSPPSVVIGTTEDAVFPPNRLKALTREQVEAAEFLKRGARVVSVDAFAVRTGRDSEYGFGLSALIDDGTSLLILPPPAAKDESRSEQVADWEVFTPYERYLHVGPGLRWSYLVSHASNDA